MYRPQHRLTVDAGQGFQATLALAGMFCMWDMDLTTNPRTVSSRNRSPSNAKKNDMKFNIDHITVNLETKSNGIRLITDIENWFIPIQTIKESKKIIELNYKIVKDHFQHKIGQLIIESDLENVSLNIVLYYFQMYNHWRTMYKRGKNKDLIFLQKDFNHPYTSYRIIYFFKKIYPDNYADKCEIMLGMTSEEFNKYEIRKVQFDNK
jgi:hypothetical protein